MQALNPIRQTDYTISFARDLEAMRRFYEQIMEFPLLRVRDLSRDLSGLSRTILAIAKAARSSTHGRRDR